MKADHAARARRRACAGNRYIAALAEYVFIKFMSYIIYFFVLLDKFFGYETRRLLLTSDDDLVSPSEAISRSQERQCVVKDTYFYCRGIKAH